MADLADQPTAAPTRKVVSSTVWGAVATLVTFADDKYLGDQLPTPVEGAVIILAIAVAGYFTRNKATDVPPANATPGPEDEPYGGYGD